MLQAGANAENPILMRKADDGKQANLVAERIVQFDSMEREGKEGLTQKFRSLANSERPQPPVVVEKVPLLGELREKLQCIVCGHMYKDPVMLPCLHTVCRGCLPGTVREEEKEKRSTRLVTCPVCVEQSEVHSGTVNELVSHSVLRDEVERVEASLKVCENCENPASVTEFYCDSCAGALCATCNNSIHSMKIHRQHQVISIRTALKQRSSIKQTCPLHSNETLSIYCSSDALIICSSCMIDMHQGHSCVPLKEAMSQIRQDASILMDKGGQKERQLAETSLVLERSIANLVEEKAAVAAQIEDYFRQVVESVEARKHSLLESLENQTRIATGSLQQRCEAIKGEGDQLRHALVLSQELLEAMQETDIPLVVMRVLPRLRKLEGKAAPLTLHSKLLSNADAVGKESQTESPTEKLVQVSFHSQRGISHWARSIEAEGAVSCQDKLQGEAGPTASAAEGGRGALATPPPSPPASLYSQLGSRFQSASLLSLAPTSPGVPSTTLSLSNPEVETKNDPFTSRCRRCQQCFHLADNEEENCHFHLLPLTEGVFPCCGQMPMADGCQTDFHLLS